MTFRIALASDLHLDFADLTLKNEKNADVLILSGDILEAQPLGDFSSDRELTKSQRQHQAIRYRKFMENISTEFLHTVVIMGNHEYYGGQINSVPEILKNEYSKFDNIHFLEDDNVKIDKYLFVGGTLWTDFNKSDPLSMYSIMGAMNDYKKIRDSNYSKIKPNLIRDKHKKSIRYINETLANNPNTPTIVVGHHAPTSLSIHERHKNGGIINYAYYSDLSNMILDNPQVILWTCGHVHHRHRYYVGDTLVACNPRGYYGFDPIAENFALKHIDVSAMPEKNIVENDYDWVLD